ncbi:MAG TPA: hypothetical protein VNX21_05405 [Candidatus Thermoplasmatota archaeon]|nr:hypothetical protein [Candidatus Thermoplasmatota archaeon]
MDGETVNRAIREALRDARDVIEERGILVVARLEARVPLDNEPPALHQAIYTIFRGLPERLPRGATLYVSTRDRAGGDVELTWEAREEPGPADPSPREALRHGPYGDLLDLALLGLESICRARAGLAQSAEPPPSPSSSVLARDVLGKVRRRYAFLIPTRTRDPSGRY